MPTCVLQSMKGVKHSQATLDAGQERTPLGEPMGPSLDPKRPMRFVPACELDAVSGALLEMEQDHESPEQVRRARAGSHVRAATGVGADSGPRVRWQAHPPVCAVRARTSLACWRARR